VNEINLIEKIYRQTDNAPQLLSELLSDFSNWSFANPGLNELHPCVINGKSAIVCQRDLSRNDPIAFAALKVISDRYGLFLKEDSRIIDDGFKFNRRQGIAIMLSFCLSMFATTRQISAAETNSASAINVVTHLSLPLNTMQAKMSINADGAKVLSLRHASLPLAATVFETHSKKNALLAVDTVAETKIKDFLQAAYRQTSIDPKGISDDFAALANYYARYPQVIALFSVLFDKPVQLLYKSDSWQTQAWGSENSVDQVSIYFDTRTAAQFINRDDCAENPACNISPADALLHELLHAKLMLVESQEFFKTGGLKPTLYPIEHERTVISEENGLYQTMNQEDGLARPIRSRHNGEIFHVECALCMLPNNAAFN
jgi:hypothetical protein